ncbi:hypothetical protein CW709_00850 [Candidatus Bathyarchaeota archaeon]|nr:MAG: hypothetical protein CW709_00850 [Candidatus Bathyarchaeota archaeon]
MALFFGFIVKAVLGNRGDVPSISLWNSRTAHLKRLSLVYENVYRSAQSFGYGFTFLLFSFLMAILTMVIGDTEQASLYWILANLFFTIGASIVAVGLIRLRRIKRP